MKKLLISTVLILSLVPVALIAQGDPKQRGLDAITMESIQGQLEFLASDWTEGRGTGERGNYLAGDYVASMFKVFGAKPMGDMVGRGGGRTYFQNFSLTETISSGESSLVIKNGAHEITFQQGVDYTSSTPSISTKFEAPIVFVGYGIRDSDLGLDDFAGVDVKGKIILRLTGFPGMNNPESPMYKKVVQSGNQGAVMNSINRIKNSVASELGVTGIIEVTPGVDIARTWGVTKEGINLSYNEGRTRRTTWSRMRLDGSTLPATAASLTVTERTADFILQGSGIDLNQYIANTEEGRARFRPVALTSSALLDTKIEQQRVRVRNVVAMIEGERTDEFVVVGAHMDHMGMEPGIVWNGADDNASGTVGVMMLAKAVAATGVKPQRTIIFAAWTAEEKGLIGSRYFATNPPTGKIESYKFYLNYDMIARDAANDVEGNMAGMQFTNTYPKLEEWTRDNAGRYNINLDINYRGSAAPSGGSDFSSFTRVGVPIISWMAAFHPDYHQPSDTVEKINWEKMQNIIRLGFLQLWDAANNDLQ